MNKDTVAILLATYNGEKHLREFLDSLALQTYRSFRVFVRDDGSTDGTLNIIEQYSSSLNVVFIPSSERLGPARSFLKLLAEAGGSFDYYFFADQDDVWFPDKVERALGRLAGAHGQPELYCSRLELVDSELNHISFTRLPRVVSLNNALVENIATGCTVAINSAARNIITQRTPSIVYMHDWWAYLVISCFGSVVCDDYVSIKYRQHGSNVVGLAINPYQDFRRRLERFLKKGSDGVFGVSDQAKEFLCCYEDRLTEQQVELVQRLTNKGGIFGRVRLSCSSSFVRQKRLDTLILRTLFLLGRF